MAPALVAAAKRLMRTATEIPRGASRRLQTFPSTTKSGFPGGWGMPTVWAVAMYSLASQNAVVGARVTAYSVNAATAAAAAVT